MRKSTLGIWGASLIVAGTSIGAGMLALPVVTGLSGFFPSLLVLVSSWAFMTITGLMFCELAVWLKHDVNILSMATTTLGAWVKGIVWILYLFLFYCLTIAYLVGGGNFLTDVIGDPTTRILLFGALFISCVVMGKRVVDPMNQLLVIGLFISYCGFVIIGVPLIDLSLLTHKNWSYLYMALPVTFTSFGFQGTIPTLANWMEYDLRKMRYAVIIGTSVTLLVYVLWQGLFLGIVPPSGPHGLEEALDRGLDAVHPLHYFTQNEVIWNCARGFAFFALVTSFLGVGIGLVDFLSDGLKIPKKGIRNRGILTICAFFLPLFFAVIYPHLFLKALGLAGGFGCATLLGILPILMVWKARHIMHQPVCKNILGKKWVLCLLLVFVSFEIICEILNLID